MFAAWQCKITTLLMLPCTQVHADVAQPVSVDYRARTGVTSREEYERLYQRSIQDPAGFWADLAREFHWERPVGGDPFSLAV